MAGSSPGLSDFWSANTVLDTYERGAKGHGPEEAEPKREIDRFVKDQRVAQSAHSAALDARHTQAIRATGPWFIEGAPDWGNPFQADNLGLQVDGWPLCCPLSIIWKKGDGAEAVDAGYPKGVWDKADSDAFMLDQIVEAKWSDAGECDCACCEFRIFVAFYITFMTSEFEYTGKPISSADLTAGYDTELGMPKAGSNATTVYWTPASSFPFVSDATFSDRSDPLSAAEHARDHPDDDEHFSDLKKDVDATQAGAENDPDTKNDPCYAKWTDTVEIRLPKVGWTFILLQFLAVIRPTAECGGRAKWKMEEFRTMIKSGSPPITTGIKASPPIKTNR